MSHGPVRDPFGELGPERHRRRYQLLGCRFEFLSAEPRLLALAEAAFGGLRAQLLPGRRTTIRIHLRLGPDSRAARWHRPPAMRTHAAGGLISGVIDAGNFAVLSPPGHTALVVFSPRLLAHGYYARYELLEFCAYTLSSRCQGLVPLHGAMVGRADRGVLVLGASGSGKSTLVLHAMLRGLALLSEDAVFVEPASLYATGVPGFLHLRADARRWLRSPGLRLAARGAVRIRRRSGVRKLELDARHTGLPLARRTMRVQAIVFLSARPAAAGHGSRRLSMAELHRGLRREQAFAAAQPGWSAFMRSLRTVPAYELRRQLTPDGAAALLGELLGGRGGAAMLTRAGSGPDLRGQR